MFKAKVIHPDFSAFFELLERFRLVDIIPASSNPRFLFIIGVTAEALTVGPCVSTAVLS
jgi:hypothetical protein